MEWKQDHETGYLKSQIGEEDRKDTMLLAPVHDGRNRKLQHGVGYPQRVVNQVAFPVHRAAFFPAPSRSEEHTSELQSLAYLVCRLLLEKKKKKTAAYEY